MPADQHTIIVRINHTGYGCVLCQRYHQPGDELYESHHWRQSKHGVQRWTETRCFLVDCATRETTEVPACRVLPAGEY